MTLSSSTPSEIIKAVREHYARIARSGRDSDGCGCCAPADAAGPSPNCGALGEILGYRREDLDAVPEGANLGLGCGNPLALAGLQPGETVLDLGSGAGFDCFLAARRVAPDGLVIGVDMTPEMVTKARDNARQADLHNVEFRLGEIEHLPVADNHVDLILSNCVINLAADKGAVFREAFRVLKPGGRLSISDIVALQPLPEKIRDDLALYTGCVAGALEIGKLEQLMAEAGFREIHIEPQIHTSQKMAQIFPDTGLEGYIASAHLSARKPGTAI
jgi:SAM-dependent methyltransferase